VLLMAFVKRTEPTPDATGDLALTAQDRRNGTRDIEGLLLQLQQPDSDARRWAALDLAGEPSAVSALAARLAVEPSRPARDAIVTALVETGGESAATELAKHLHSEDAAVRNAAVGALALLPATAELVPGLLDDDDPDVRVLCVMVLASLRDPRVPGWLLDVIEHDEDANVCGCAVDVLAEVGEAEICDALAALPGRFPDDPFLPVAVRVTIARLGGVIS
jgi:HEAT repeat protein